MQYVWQRVSRPRDGFVHILRSTTYKVVDSCSVEANACCCWSPQWLGGVTVGRQPLTCILSEKIPCVDKASRWFSLNQELLCEMAAKRGNRHYEYVPVQWSQWRLSAVERHETYWLTDTFTVRSLCPYRAHCSASRRRQPLAASSCLCARTPSSVAPYQLRLHSLTVSLFQTDALSSLSHGQHYSSPETFRF